MPNKKKNDGFIMQAGILAMAGIIVRIIGLLYNSPLAAILGDEGIGYYNMAYNAYAIVLLISSYSIPSAISKVIAQKLAVKEYRNAHRIFKCALIYVLVVGGIASLFVFFGAGLLVQVEYARLPLQVLAPTIFFSGILGVLRGYFQAHKTMVQTSVSQILEQILNAAFSILMAYLLVKTFSASPESQRLSYGAAGGAIGTGVGVLTALLFITGVYALNRKTIRKRMQRDLTLEESYGEVFKLIFLVVTPFILSTFIYNANTFINQTIYQNLMIGQKGFSQVAVASHMGVAGKAVKISNIPIALASAMATALIPGISGDYAKKDLRSAREKASKAMKVTMLISIPAAVGIGVLARPVMWLLYPQQSIDLSASLLAVLAVSVIFYAISTLSNAILQSIGRLNSPVINAAIALVVQTGILIAMILFMDSSYGPYYYIIAIVCYSFLMCLLNGSSLHRHLGYKQEIRKTFLLPLFASAVMGVAAYLVYFGLYTWTKISALALTAAVAVGVAVYFLLILSLKAVTEEELRSMPKGYLIIRIARKGKLLKPAEQTQPRHTPNRTKKAATSSWKAPSEANREDEDYWLDE